MVGRGPFGLTIFHRPTNKCKQKPDFTPVFLLIKIRDNSCLLAKINFDFGNKIIVLQEMCSKAMQYKINSEEAYQQVMERVQSYLQKSTEQGGRHTLTSVEKEDLRHLSLLAETWEDGIPLMPIRQPRTLTEMLELKMYERKMKQKDLAAMLGITATRLSEVMKGKRKVNMDLAKRLYKVLHIDAAFILEQA